MKELNSNWKFLFILILIVSGLTSFTVQMISTVLPLYCVDIGKTITDAGIFLGFYSFALIVSRPFAGKWCDEKEKYKIALIGMIIFIISVVFLFGDISAKYYPIYQTIEGIGFSILSTALAALLVDIIPHDLIVRCIALFTVIKSLSISLGASLAATISETIGTRYVFIFTLAIVFISLICFLPLRKANRIKVEEIDYKIEKNNSKEYKGINKFIEKSILPYCILQFVFTFSLTLGTSYLPSYAKSIGFVGIGIYYTVSAITMFLSRTLFSRIFELIDSKKSFIYGSLLGALTTIGILFANNIFIFVIISFINAIGISLVNPILNVKAAADCDADRRGVAASTYYGALDLGSGVGATLWGILIPMINYQFSFIFATILLIINMIYGLVIFNKKEA